MESGVRLLKEDFAEAVDKGVPLRILCGNYLNITQPQALYLLKDSLGDKVDLRFYNVPNKSFHPKAYIFEYQDRSEIFVGSSNVSRSALATGIEWNYRICSKTSPEDYSHFKNTFEELFLNHSIIVDDDEMRRYSKNWKHPKVFEDLEKLENGIEEEAGSGANNGLAKLKAAAEPQPGYTTDTEEIEETGEHDQCSIIQYPRPIGPQIEALYELKKSRLNEWDKGIVVAATGVGKTFLVKRTIISALLQHWTSFCITRRLSGITRILLIIGQGDFTKKGSRTACCEMKRLVKMRMGVCDLEENKSIKYDKLIRDKIPEVVESTASKAIVEVLDDANYKKYLDINIAMVLCKSNMLAVAFLIGRQCKYIALCVRTLTVASFDATLGMGGWLDLSQQGLSPCMMMPSFAWRTINY